MRLAGPAALRLQETFAEDWYFSTGEDLVTQDRFPAVEPVGTELVQVVDSGPDHVHENIHTVFFTAISRAEKRILITTPYFVPDPVMLEALKAASWRGLDVRLLLPGKSDLWLVKIAGRSYYRELLEAGVRLFEHRPGMLHAKTMVIDGVWSTIGSANMDIRSFRLNFECNVLVTGRTFAEKMEAIFQADTERAHPITLESQRRKKPGARLAEAFCRVLSPVL
jgi:cardiolipin synthase